MNEQQALDDQNCNINNAVPLNIEGSQSASLPNDSKSPCIRTRTIDSTSKSPPSPPGSEYTVKAQKITGSSGEDVKISRVTLNNTPIHISTPPDAITEVRLYSSPVNPSVPLMFEFIPRGGGTSTFYESKGGSSWIEVGKGKSNNFYADKSGTTPQPALSEQLDKVLCSQGHVTIDLSHSRSTSSDRTYCCEHHKGEKRVTVSEVSDSSSSTIFYKHEIKNGYGFAGIYYKTSSGDRKSIKIPGLQASRNGSVKLYTFYDGNIPKLIYVDSGNPRTKGWYKGGIAGDRWEKVPNAPSGSPDEVKNNNNDFEAYVEELKCTSLQKCPKKPEVAKEKEKSERRDGLLEGASRKSSSKPDETPASLSQLSGQRTRDTSWLLSSFGYIFQEARKLLTEAVKVVDIPKTDSEPDKEQNPVSQSPERTSQHDSLDQAPQPSPAAGAPPDPAQLPASTLTEGGKGKDSDSDIPGTDYVGDSTTETTDSSTLTSLVQL